MDFGKEERKLVGEINDACVASLPLLFTGDENKFMNKVKTILNPPVVKADGKQVVDRVDPRVKPADDDSK